MNGKSLEEVLAKRQWPLLLGFVLAGSALYLGWARWQTGSFGYPLDDAWIHQVFARNIALRGELSFNPGELSAGSTSPLWTLLLSLGYLLPIGYFAWSMALGMASLFLCGLLASRLTRLLLPTAPSYLSLVVGILTVTNWYLVWTALSGMETVGFTALTLLVVMVYYLRPQGLLLGFLGGITVLVRPEGSLLFAAVMTGTAWRGWRAGKTEWKKLVVAIVVFAALTTPYLAFNRSVGGTLLPTTAGAKMAIYGSSLTLQSGLNFLVRLVSFYLLAPTCLLLVFALLAVRSIRSVPLMPLLWVLLFLGAYFLTLRAFYNWGRYFIPLTPWVMAYGVWGIHGLWRNSPGRQRLYLVANLVLFLAFWVGMARVYGSMVEDVARQQASVGRWLGENSPSDAVVAAWDIGAVGHFSHRRVIDLGGLVTPAALANTRDETALASFLREQRVDYVVQFTGNAREKLPALPLETVLSYGVEVPTHFGGDLVTVYRIGARP